MNNKNKKMKKLLTIIAFLGLTSVAFVSCKKDDDDNGSSTPVAGDVVIDITNIAGTQNVDETGATNYTNAFGETFSVTKLKYYISNVQLLNNGNVVYTMPESYFLVDESVAASKLLTLPDVPGGSYTSVRFMLGVDSTRNVSGSQTGALDQANGMFWSWNSGYIFLKLEGTASAATSGNIMYQVGGFKQALNQNATRIIDIDFNGGSLSVNGDQEAEIHLFADILKLFNANQNIQISNVSVIHMPGADAMKFADNYADMFTFDHLHN
jgi:hypothetical protein